MVFNVYKFVISVLYHAFGKNDKPDEIEVTGAIAIVRVVKGMAASVKKMNKEIPLTEDDCEYVETCVKALEWYNQGVDIEGIAKKYRHLCNKMDKHMSQNYRFIELLSFKIHMRSGISYWYVQRYILAKLYADSKYRLRGSDDETDFSFIGSDENTPMAHMIIDVEMCDETRFLPLPQVTTLSPAEITQLHNWVLKIVEMCLHLPADMQKTVREEFMSLNYTINPKTQVCCLFEKEFGNIHIRGANRLVDFASNCGGIKITLHSAFWIHCLLPDDVEDWSMIFEEGFHLYLCEELSRVSEIDNDIIQNVKAVLRHPLYRHELLS